MILFKQDWDNYPTAIVDYKTPNKSFLEFASKLHERGIQNCLFMLALYQPELQGVDPYSPDLTKEQKQMIAVETEWNPWYFFREIARVPVSGTDVPVMLQANRANISLFWTFLAEVNYYLIQIRQTGKSLNTDMLGSWLYVFRCRNTNFLLITKDNKLRTENVARLTKIRALFPKWLVFDNPNDAQNSHTLTYKIRHNVYSTGVAQKSEDDALKLGRGSTVPFVHIDEGPFIDYVDITIPAATAAGGAARDSARQNGTPYGTIFTTTAGKLDSRSGKYMHELLEGGMPWTERLYDCVDKKELHKVITKTARGRMLLISGVFNHKQVGKTDKWLYGKIAETGVSGEEADRDFFNRWTSGGIGSPLETETLNRIRDGDIDLIDSTIYREGYVVNWYVDATELKALKRLPILIGLDTSDSIGGDDIAVVITHPYTMETIGVATINDSSIPAIAAWAANQLLEFGESVLVIEKKSSAQTFIDVAISVLAAAGHDPFKRIYNRIVDNKDTDKQMMQLYRDIRKVPLNRRDEDFYSPYRKYFGFNTTGSTRKTLYSDVLKHACKTYAEGIRDKQLSGQIRKLVVRNNRVDHPEGGNDDLVIAWLMTNWLVMYGKNLDFYGIETHQIKMRVGGGGRVATEKELKRHAYLETVREELDNTLEKYKKANNPYLMHKLEHRIAKLESELKGSDLQVNSINDIINDVRRMRRHSPQRQRTY